MLHKNDNADPACRSKNRKILAPDGELFHCSLNSVLNSTPCLKAGPELATTFLFYIDNYSRNPVRQELLIRPYLHTYVFRVTASKHLPPRYDFWGGGGNLLKFESGQSDTDQSMHVQALDGMRNYNFFDCVRVSGRRL